MLRMKNARPAFIFRGSLNLVRLYAIRMPRTVDNATEHTVMTMLLTANDRNLHFSKTLMYEDTVKFTGTKVGGYEKASVNVLNEVMTRKYIGKTVRSKANAVIRYEIASESFRLNFLRQS
jgi:hypothetical protein